MTEQEFKALQPFSAEEYDEKEKDLKLKAAGFEAKYLSLHADWKAIETACTEFYARLPKQNVMYFDSPISPLRLLSNFRFNLAKLGWGWAGHFIGGNENVKKFSVVVNDALKWSRAVMVENDKRMKEALIAQKEAAKKVAPPKDIRGE